MSEVKILWVDDEIDLLKPQLFFLEKKSYVVATVSNGYDALDYLNEHNDVDVIFLDESMPGITGLETLEKIKEINSNIPVVMITKNEAENLMEEAIGSQIDDYLIKPVNPNQILMTLKKLIDNKRLVNEKTSIGYQQAFRSISMDMNSGLDYKGWIDIYKRIISWELKMENNDDDSIFEILNMQKTEANREFSKFIEKNYLDWVSNQEEEKPVMSNNLLNNYFFPRYDAEKSCVFLLLDNLRLDQWLTIEPIISELYRVESEETFYSILPTTTQYSRNAIFAGMTPLEIYKNFPDKWVFDHEDNGKNLNEEFFFKKQVDRIIRQDKKVAYHKITNIASAKQLSDQALNFLNNDITVVVWNFIDMLSHARTEMEVLKELANDDKGYRSLVRSWFINSPLWMMLQKLASKDIQLFITTDHGTVKVNQPTKVLADRDTTSNLRYKVGKKLKYNEQASFAITQPDSYGLPQPNLSSTFIFAKENYFYLYPNNYNYYNKLYKDSFQHGGISMEEIICPFVMLTPK